MKGSERDLVGEDGCPVAGGRRRLGAMMTEDMIKECAVTEWNDALIFGAGRLL